MDTSRLPTAAAARRRELTAAATRDQRRIEGGAAARPIRIERNVWIGFDVCVLPGVTIGEGSVIGARSVVVENVPPFSVAVGNPARIIRKLDAPKLSEHV